jgi:hypothetical protein
MTTSPLQLNPDGTVTLSLDDGTWLIRRPKLRQFRELVESLARLRKTLNDEIAEAEETKVDVPVTRPDELMLGWLNEVLATLGPVDAQLTDDNADAWMTTSGVSTDLITHWRTRPPVRGGS